MDKESKRQSKAETTSVDRSKTESGSPNPADRPSLVWVRDDGAICVGDGCIVIKPERGTNNLDIDIAPTKCGEATADAFMETIIKTVGKGGNTRFTVKSEFQDEGKSK